MLQLIPGAMAAITSVALGYPFDTVKVRMQTGMYRGTLNCLLLTLRAEGPVALYRGAYAPFVVLAGKRSVQFFVYEELCKSYNPFLSGFIAGIIGTAAGCPMHVVKTNMQNTTKERYRSTWSCISTIFQSEGFAGFYRGFTPNLIKDSTFATMYLGTYGKLRERLPKTDFGHFLAGGIASCLTWLLCFPTDACKTAVQAGEPAGKWFSRVRQRGLHSAWHGVSPALLRVFPVSGASMTVYEMVRTHLGISSTTKAPIPGL
eukprot:TRINITY_DN20400_c0_g1_i2.p1 TRINITY_DN20400_c0_g1~~TRINITY_DN20400_c0_g1_i2.p1  ORF type:complete len:260 (+),score=16.43 TRINITY_DN20400_c0_g1_i2:588-1367(+)